MALFQIHFVQRKVTVIMRAWSLMTRSFVGHKRTLRNIAAVFL